MSTTRDEFYGMLTDKLGVSSAEATPGTTFETLDLDSLALIELTVLVQKRFGVLLDETELTPERTLGEVVDLLESRLPVSG